MTSGKPCTIDAVYFGGRGKVRAEVVGKTASGQYRVLLKEEYHRGSDMGSSLVTFRKGSIVLVPVFVVSFEDDVKP